MELLLGPILRHVSDTTATIWVETDQPGEVCVLGHRATTFCVWGHHYGLVIVGGLAPGSITPYEVELDGEVRWPAADSLLPPSVIRAVDPARHDVRVLFGSCRAAAPHTEPYVLEAKDDPEGRGVDALRAVGLRLLQTEPNSWSDLLVMLGDQVYADDSSPAVRRRIEASRDEEHPLDPDMVADFEQYCWLYREAWTPDVERWLLSVVPSVMIFDDHDMIDDWNISDAWVRDIRQERWWNEHVIGGLVSYWIYQHLGNLSPERIGEEGMLEALGREADGGRYLRRWAEQSEEFTPVPGGYSFSYARELGPVRLVMVDARNGRVLEPGARRMVDEQEWAFISEECAKPCRHLLIATSLPVFVPGGLHGVQQWNEAVCDGAWGRPFAWLGEKLRRELDMEDWAAFDLSFRDLERLLLELGRGQGPNAAPETISVLSGDIHFSYLAEATPRTGPPMHSRVHQLVSSPMRNVLRPIEKRVLGFAASRSGRWIGSRLQRWAGRTPSALVWDYESDPLFANNIGLLELDERSANVQILQAGRDGERHHLTTAIELAL